MAKNLLNAENDYSFGIGNGFISASIEIFPDTKIIKIDFSTPDNYYYRKYKYTDTKKAMLYSNRVIKAMKRATKRNLVPNFSFYNSINENYYNLITDSESESFM